MAPAYYTRPNSLTVAKAAGPDRWTASAVLTYPVRDAVGDFVNPAGGDWSRGPWPQNPVFDWHHGVPVGRGVVTMKSIPGPDGARFDGPVGTMAFFRTEAECKGLDLWGRDTDGRKRTFSPAEAVDASAQAWQLVVGRYADGTSIEFVPGESRTIGKAFIGHGDAKHYETFTPIRFAVTPLGMNGDAQVLPDSIGKAVELVRTGRLPDGGRASASILKAFGWVEQLPRRASARGGYDSARKAMPYPQQQGGGYAADPAADPAQDPNAQPQQPAGPQPKPAVAAYKNLSQGILDLLGQFEQDMEMSEHPEALAKMQEVLADLQQRAEEINGFADDTADAIAGKMRRPEDAAAVADEEEDEDDPEATPVATPGEDDPAGGDEPPPKKGKPPFPAKKAAPLVVAIDGGIVTKAFPGWSPRRLLMSDLRPAGHAEPDPPPAPDPPADPELKAAEAEYAAAQKRLKKATKEARPYITAAGS